MIYHLFILNREANGGMGDYVDEEFTHISDAKAHVAGKPRVVWADIAITDPETGRLRRLETYHEALRFSEDKGWTRTEQTEPAAT